MFAAFILLAVNFSPGISGLSGAGQSTIALTLFFLFLLVTEALPVTLASLLTIGLIPVFGAREAFYGAVQGFSHPVIFFILSSFAIAGAIMNVPLPKRILLFLVKRTKPGFKNILFSMMVATAVVSFFISNVPACAIMMVIALEFVNMFENGEQKKRAGKILMIAIPVATMIGGIATPASSSLNLLALSILYSETGISVSFVQWMFVGVPLVVVLIPFAWFLMVKVYELPDKPNRTRAYNAPSPECIISQNEIPIEKFLKKLEAEVNPRFERRELIVLAAMSLMLVLWLLSSWVESMEIFTVSVLGAVFLMLPGIEIITPKKFVESINWDIIFISGTVLSLAAAFIQNGVSEWLLELFLNINLDLHVSLLVGIAALSAFLLLTVFTSAPALITVLAAPFVAVALAGGIPPGFLIIALAICSGNCYLLPLDTVQLITYSKGYYSMTDMGKSTVFLQLALIVLLALWIPFAGEIVGIN